MQRIDQDFDIVTADPIQQRTGAVQVPDGEDGEKLQTQSDPDRTSAFIET